MIPFDSTPLNDGNKVPQIAFGTGASLFGRDVTDFVGHAVESGFWHIDTAAGKNENYVGSAIRESGLKREEFYVTTKYDGGNIREEFEKNLKRLGLSYVDLYLIHVPHTVKDNIGGAWAELEKLEADGLTRSIGISNFGIQDLQTLLKTAKVVPAVNQVQFHPYNYSENTPY